MPDPTTRLWIAGILSGLATIAVVAFLVLGPGRFHPSPPSLEGHPVEGLPGRIAYVDEDGCIIVVELGSATEREIHCDASRPQALTFINGHTLAFTVYSGGPTPRWTAIDIPTGDSTGLGAFPDPGWEWDQTAGGRIYVDGDGEVFVVEDGNKRSLYAATYPEHDRPTPVAISSDGAWLMAFYSPPRSNGPELWIIAMDGSVARTVTKDVTWDPRGVSWWIDGFGAAPAMRHPELPTARAR
jgi:hypothetical protein